MTNTRTEKLSIAVVFQPKTEPQRHLKTLNLWEMTCSSTFYNYAKFQTSTKYKTSVIAIVIPIFL